MFTHTITLLLLSLVILGCQERPQSQRLTTLNAGVKFEDLPVKFTVKQRTTTIIPGSKELLSINIGDVTRGQVDISLLLKSGSTHVGPISMKEGEQQAFPWGGEEYLLHLEKLNNALIGEDFATFVIVKPDSIDMTDAQLIEKLLNRIATHSEARFVRNGTEYSGKDAADHLRTKYQSAKNHIRTPQEFIDKIAAKSSISGEEYVVKLPGKEPVKAREFLMQELEKLKANGSSKP